MMEKTLDQTMKNESCSCCKPGCSCGDCAKCGSNTNQACCAGSCSSNAGCSCCGRFKGYCWVCKIGKLLFGLLVVLALIKLAFGGMGMGMRGYKGMMGCGCMGGGNGSGGCMMMKENDDSEKKGWFNRFEKNDDKDDMVVSGTATQ